MTRRISITANNLVTEDEYKREGEKKSAEPEQLSMFDMLVNSDEPIKAEDLPSEEPSDDRLRSKDLAPVRSVAVESEAELGDKDISEDVLEKEKQVQEAMLKIKKRFGKNAILKGTNLQEGATAKERNAQIGGHKA